MTDPWYPQPRRLNDEQLSALYPTRHWIRSARRQEKRLQEAWVRHWRILHSYPDSVLESGEPADLADASDRLFDDAYYLLMSAHHALATGPRLVRGAGLALPTPKTEFVVEKLRHVYEHWPDWHGPSTEPEHLRRWSEKSRGGRDLAKDYPRAFPRSYGGDEHHLDVIAAVLHMRQVRDDLDYLDQALGYWLGQHAEATAESSPS